jgi:hypothetical protein
LKPEVHIALIHYPVLNKTGEIVATAVTNLDIHDNARSARTFGITSYHIVTPLDAQIELVTRILDHWRKGYGAKRVPNRVDAMNLIQVSRSLDDAIDEIKAGREVKPVIISTCARDMCQTGTYAGLKKQMADSYENPYLILFGTGYGLSDEILNRSDIVLEPIGTPSDWNHLSVRSAVAITLDRLLG